MKARAFPAVSSGLDRAGPGRVAVRRAHHSSRSSCVCAQLLVCAMAIQQAHTVTGWLARLTPTTTAAAATHPARHRACDRVPTCTHSRPQLRCVYVAWKRRPLLTPVYTATDGPGAHCIWNRRRVAAWPGAAVSAAEWCGCADRLASSSPAAGPSWSGAGLALVLCSQADWKTPAVLQGSPLSRQSSWTRTTWSVSSRCRYFRSFTHFR